MRAAWIRPFSGVDEFTVQVLVKPSTGKNKLEPFEGGICDLVRRC